MVGLSLEGLFQPWWHSRRMLFLLEGLHVSMKTWVQAGQGAKNQRTEETLL